MKKILMILAFLSVTVVYAQQKTEKKILPPKPSLAPGQTLKQLDADTNQSIKEFRNLYGRDPRANASINEYEKLFREAARLFKLYLTNPNPIVLQSYYDAYDKILEARKKVENASEANKQAVAKMTGSLINKTKKIIKK